MKGEPIGGWHVHCDEVRPFLHQARDERHAPGEAVELGDNQRRTPHATFAEGVIECWSVSARSAFHFLKLSHQNAIRDEPLDGFPLSIKPEPGLTLLPGAASIVCDVAFHDGYVCFNGR